MKPIFVVVAVVLAVAAGSVPAQAVPGKMTGGVIYSLPSWFKASFLNFKEDAEDAKKQGKHVMLFLHLDECPYCERMLRENFVSGEAREYVQQHFDVVAINIRGTLETVWVDGRTYSERSLSRLLNVFATPTMVFLDPDGKKVLQLTGYRDPPSFRHALDYVQSKSYRQQPFADYLAARSKPAVYTLLAHPQFAKTANLKVSGKPLAVLFEDRQCSECARFHEKTLNHPDVLAAMKPFVFVRLDADSTETIMDPRGNKTTPAQWAKSLDLTYRPAVVLFNRGKEVVRADARLYHYHFKEMLRYVSGGHDADPGGFSQYNAARRNELLQQGKTIDYGE